MESSRRMFQNLWSVTIQPEELGWLLTSRKPSPGERKCAARRLGLTKLLHKLTGTRVQPEDCRSDGIVSFIN
jgi:hypothetical protein